LKKAFRLAANESSDAERDRIDASSNSKNEEGTEDRIITPTLNTSQATHKAQQPVLQLLPLEFTAHPEQNLLVEQHSQTTHQEQPVPRSLPVESATQITQENIPEHRP
jgi:hypothetical protein